MTARILQGDCRDVLRGLPAGSVHCCVTSPPYYGLRDYGTATWEGGDPACDHSGSRRGHGDEKQSTSAGTSRDPVSRNCRVCGARRIDRQLGLEATPDAYVAAMVAVFREVRRVLRRDGTLWLNLGMSYASGDTHPSRSRQPGRVPAYDNDGTEPRCSPELDSVCPDPDGGPQAGFPIHRARIVDTDPQRQLFEQRPAPTDRDIERPGCAEDLASIALLAARLSTNPALPENARDAFARATRVWDDLLHAPTSLADALECVRRAACNPYNGSPELAFHSRDTDASGLACRCGSCGFCFIRLTMAALRFKPKDEMNIPHLVALALQADGWYLRQTLVWGKPNPMPESVIDRCTKSHEYLFLLSKSERYYFDAAAIAEPSAYPGDDRHLRTDNTIEFARPDGGSRARTAQPTADMRNKRSVWTIATAPFPDAHFATFPPALVEPCILAGCPVGGTVLDPFLGAGTTALVADRLGRNAIGIELNPAYAKMAKRRIEDDAGLFAQVAAE